jgi:hypothetical protein
LPWPRWPGDQTKQKVCPAMWVKQWKSTKQKLFPPAISSQFRPIHIYIHIM